MTTAEKSKLIGRHALRPIDKMGDLKMAVELLDIREAYGRVDALVRPLAGAGTAWVALHSLHLEG